MSMKFREEVFGAAVLFVLINLTLFPFLWGNLSLRDSVTIASLYPSGSRSPAAAKQPVFRELDSTAPALQTEPWFVLEGDVVARERVAPLWNPYSGFGTPLAANMQSQPYSPFAWITTTSKSPLAYNIFVAVRVYVAGLLAFLFLRLFVGLWPALVGGAAFMYTGYIWLYVTMPEISVAAFVPGLFYGIELLLRRQTLTRVAVFAVLVALCVVGGMPESLALATIAAYAYGLARLLGDPVLRTKFRASVPAVLGASILGLGVSAVQLLPFLEYLPSSFSTHTGTVDGLAVDPLFRASGAMYLAPLMKGPPLNNIFTGFAGFDTVRGFFGCATVFFACVAVVDRIGAAIERRPSVRPVAIFTAIALFCAAKRFGNPSVNWIGSLPLFGLINFPKYEEAVLGFSVSVLAAFGVAAIVERRVSTFSAALAAAIPSIVLTVAAGSLKAPFAALTTYRWYYRDGLVFALTCLLAALTIAVLARLNRLRGRAIALAALALVAGEPNLGYIVPMFYVIDGEPTRAADTLDGAPYVAYLQRRTKDGSRFLGRDLTFFPDWSAAFGVRDVRDVDAIYYRRYLPFVSAFLSPGSDGELTNRFWGLGPIDFGADSTQRFLQMSSIRFVVTTHPIAIRGPAARALKGHRLSNSPSRSEGSAVALYRPVFKDGPVIVSEFAHPLPRLSLFRHVQLVPNDAAALAAIPSSAFEPSSEAIVEDADHATDLTVLAHAPRAPAEAARLTRDSSRIVESALETKTPVLAVLNDTFFPGWTATLDGRSVTILHANYLFRGVVVGAGRHVLTFSYDPRSFTIGWAVSLASSIVVAVFLALGRTRRPRLS